MKNIRVFYLECSFSEVKFSIYLNRHVFVITLKVDEVPIIMLQPFFSSFPCCPKGISIHKPVHFLMLSSHCFFCLLSFLLHSLTEDFRYRHNIWVFRSSPWPQECLAVRLHPDPVSNFLIHHTVFVGNIRSLKNLDSYFKICCKDPALKGIKEDR